MNTLTVSLIEKSGTGIRSADTGIEKSGTGISFSRAIIMLFIVSFVWGPAFGGLQGSDGDVSSARITSSLPAIAKNESLATVTFRDNYRAISGYGYIESDYAQISLYSLEYVHVINSGDDSSHASILVQGAGTNSNSGETAPVQGAGTNSMGLEGQLKAWGIAEVVLSERGIADVIVYRLNDEGTLEEVGVYSGVEVH